MSAEWSVNIGKFILTDICIFWLSKKYTIDINVNNYNWYRIDVSF